MNFFSFIFILISLFLLNVHASTPSLVDYLNAPANSLSAKYELSEDSQVSADISALNGGTLSLKTVNGDLVQLIIPANALANDTHITMTFIKNISASFEVNNSLAVQLQPEGLQFSNPAQLVFIPKNKIALNQLTTLSSDGQGYDISLALINMTATTPDQVVLILNHFSTYSVFGSLTAREIIFNAFNNLTYSRIQSYIANQMLINKNSGHTTLPDDLVESMQEAYDKVIKNKLKNIDSCSGGQEAIAMYLGYLRQIQLLGAGDAKPDANLVENISAKTTTLCKKEIEKACYEDHRPFDAIAAKLGLLRQVQLLNGDNPQLLDETNDFIHRCGQFELVLNSKISALDHSYSIKAEGRVKFGFENIFDTNHIYESKIQVTEVTLTPEGVTCSLTNHYAPEAKIEIKNFFMNDPKFDQSLGVFFQTPTPESKTDFICRSPDDSESFRVSLPPSQKPGESFWGGMFLTFHSVKTKNEYNAKTGNLEIFKWNVLYQELFAKKNYHQSLEEMSEDTFLEIYHKPIR